MVSYAYHIIPNDLIYVGVPGEITTAGALTCVTGTCSGFAINDLVRVSSIMTVGNNQPAMDGIAIVTVATADAITLARADGTALSYYNHILLYEVYNNWLKSKL